MKRLLISALMIMAVSVYTGSAQEGSGEMKTLSGNGNSSGGYGAFTMGYSVIDSRSAFEFGFRGMWIMNHTIALGLGGTGFMNQPTYDSADGTDNFLTGGYGGFIIEPIVIPLEPVHVAFPILIGGGGISSIKTDWDSWDNWDEFNDYIPPTQFYMLVQPGAEIELNVTHFFRLAMGASYRIPIELYHTTPEVPELSPQAVKGFVFGMSFKFGKF
jgi:hypothetical protein